MDEPTSIEYRGVGTDLTHMDRHYRLPMLAEAQAWVDSGQRPPLLTVFRDGIDVSEQPQLWPDRVKRYRGLGRLEWVGI